MGEVSRKTTSPLDAMMRRASWLVRLWRQVGGGEPLVLLGALSVAAVLWVFLWLAGEVMEGDTHAFDQALLMALRVPGNPAEPIGPLWLDIAARDITSLGGYPILTLVTSFAVGFLVIARKPSAALLVLVAVGGGALLSNSLKDLFGRPRPELVPHIVEVYTLSFPSSHAMLSTVTYLTLGALLARFQPERRMKAYLLTMALLLALLTGASRVYLGVHWPTDVLAGWCAGAAWAILCWTVALFLQQRGRVEGRVHEEEGGS